LQNTSSESFKPGRMLDELAVHDHLCFIHETREEQFTISIPFIQTGLKRGERCLYIVDENATATLLNKLLDVGVDVDQVIESEALLIVGSWETYIHQGCYDAKRLIAFLTQVEEDTRFGGFSALRVAGEVPSAESQGPEIERLLRYEYRLHEFFSSHRALAICQYNRSRWPPDLLHEVVHAHPLVLCRDSVCRSPGEAFATA